MLDHKTRKKTKTNKNLGGTITEKLRLDKGRFTANPIPCQDTSSPFIASARNLQTA